MCFLTYTLVRHTLNQINTISTPPIPNHQIQSKTPPPEVEQPVQFKAPEKWVGGSGVDSRRLEPASNLGNDFWSLFAPGELCRPTVGGANGSQLSIVTVGGPTFFFFQWTKGGVGHATGFGAENRNKQKQLKLSRWWELTNYWCFFVSSFSSCFEYREQLGELSIVGWICLSG